MSSCHCPRAGPWHISRTASGIVSALVLLLPRSLSSSQHPHSLVIQHLHYLAAFAIAHLISGPCVPASQISQLKCPLFSPPGSLLQSSIWNNHLLLTFHDILSICKCVSSSIGHCLPQVTTIHSMPISTAGLEVASFLLLILSLLSPVKPHI